MNIHVRDVPDEVKENLVELAARERMSLNAYIVRLLETGSRTANNARLLEDLPSYDIPRETIVKAVRDGRDER